MGFCSIDWKNRKEAFEGTFKMHLQTGIRGSHEHNGIGHGFKGDINQNIFEKLLLTFLIGEAKI